MKAIKDLWKVNFKQYYLGTVIGVVFLSLSSSSCKEEETVPPSDGNEDIDLQEGEGTVDIIDTIDHFGDDNQSDWSSCEMMGEYCLPTDTMVIITNCVPDASGTIRFGSRNHCTGICTCGFIEWAYPCDEWMYECNDETAAPFQYSYCETGRRILCSHDVGTRAIVREGCCDEAGYVYCERDPRPDSNLCQ